jgi:hypothetical protein
VVWLIAFINLNLQELQSLNFWWKRPSVEIRNFSHTCGWSTLIFHHWPSQTSFSGIYLNA